MKPGFAIFLLSLAPAWCQVKPAAVIASSNLPSPKASRIPLDAMKDLERTFNYRLASLADVNEPMELMGDFRAVQLDDYGVVVTSEVSLVVTPGLMPGRPKIPPELAARVHKQRVERLPHLIARRVAVGELRPRHDLARLLRPVCGVFLCAHEATTGRR